MNKYEQKYQRPVRKKREKRGRFGGGIWGKKHRNRFFLPPHCKRNCGRVGPGRVYNDPWAFFSASTKA